MVTIDEFYLCLKLDIWRCGQVSEWGKIEKLPAADVVVRKDYLRHPLVKRHLSTGLYLLDLHLLDRDEKTGERVYLVVVAVCRNTLEHIRSLCYLKVSNKMALKKFEEAVKQKVVPGLFSTDRTSLNSVTNSYRNYHKEQRLKSRSQM